jgi:hypothetical protein
VEVTELHGGHPWRAELEGPIYEAASRALESAFGADARHAGEGGSIPIVPEFEKMLGAPSCSWASASLARTPTRRTSG